MNQAVQQAAEVDSCRLQPRLEEVELNLRIEKMSDQHNYFLIWQDRSGSHCGATWHQLIDDATEAARSY